ncbi:MULTISPECIES: AbrB/MazE/SpoVT family DNA-binding domain-containing protein [unclassified Burkholderia]|uniref:AbrB/MazE/SpoVT family DNA-binding domain-containing protein n=1 Tax=unclassified Burkholderia TaxID=2613784 RepID=UPI00075C2A7D|nr:MULTISPECIES: type II toxin-antitoxin system PrlF family antitoxin [unclassified Burkholderia]AOI77016.1 AbrB family transcriptional regulator [Burkholderia sp. NRF60-BP8]KVA11680.1 AbrB family transcriptional regulator [Burkholderia sp. NRF60-BP8]KVL18884.1 AbrB family transcriptional regulator [Burkholderia sp. MSMB1826]
MFEATLTSKGQLTLPAGIRHALGLAAGVRIVFTPLDDGTVILRAKTRSLLDLQGALPSITSVPIDAMRIGDA